MDITKSCLWDRLNAMIKNTKEAGECGVEIAALS